MSVAGQCKFNSAATTTPVRMKPSLRHAPSYDDLVFYAEHSLFFLLRTYFSTEKNKKKRLHPHTTSAQSTTRVACKSRNKPGRSQPRCRLPQRRVRPKPSLPNRHHTVSLPQETTKEPPPVLQSGLPPLGPRRSQPCKNTLEFALDSVDVL